MEATRTSRRTSKKSKVLIKRQSLPWQWIHPTANNKPYIRICCKKLKYKRKKFITKVVKKENINKTYSHKSSSATSSIGESSSISMPSHVVVESRVLEIVVGVIKGFSTSSKSLASLSNARIWRLDE